MSLTDLIPGLGQVSATVKLIGAGIALAAVAVPTGGWIITAHTLHGVREWQSEVVTATTAAAHARLPVATKDVPDQIDKLGDALDKVETAGDAAVAKNATNNTRIETAQNQATKDVSNDIDTKIAAARAAGAADYARRMQAGGGAAQHSGDAGQLGGAQASNATAPADGGSAASIVDAKDRDICSDNTIKAEGWQDFWNKLIAIPQVVPDQPGS
jgi:hypothetical protein